MSKDRRDPVDTSDTPEFLGLPGVWDGSGTGLNAAMGEGMIIGVLVGQTFPEKGAAAGSFTAVSS